MWGEAHMAFPCLLRFEIGMIGISLPFIGYLDEDADVGSDEQELRTQFIDSRLLSCLASWP